MKYTSIKKFDGCIKHLHATADELKSLPWERIDDNTFGVRVDRGVRLTISLTEAYAVSSRDLSGDSVAVVIIDVEQIEENGVKLSSPRRVGLYRAGDEKREFAPFSEKQIREIGEAVVERIGRYKA